MLGVMLYLNKSTPERTKRIHNSHDMGEVRLREEANIKLVFFSGAFGVAVLRREMWSVAWC